MTQTLDAIDRKLLNLVQTQFPLATRPYHVLGEKLGVSGEEVLSRIRGLKQSSIIRNIAAIFDTRRLGYQTSLVAMKVDPDRLDQAAKVVNKHPGVSHNYARSHAFNLWYTIGLPPGSPLEETVERLRELAGGEVALPLPTLKLFKIGVKLEMDEEKSPEMEKREDGKTIFPDGKAPQAVPLSDFDIAAICELQTDLALTESPFAESAKKLNVTEEELIQLAERFKESGLLRRYAAVLYHRNAGFVANGMGVWKVPPSQIQEVGLKASAFPQVSHCYERPTYPDWPYSLFTMVHSRTVEECDKVTRAISEKIGISDYIVLYSTKEYKKVRIKYFSPEFAAWEREYMGTSSTTLS